MKDENFTCEYCEKEVKKLGKRRDDYAYAELFGAYCNTKLYPANIFENYSEIKFEDGSYMIVRDYVAYLENRYERTNFYRNNIILSQQNRFYCSKSRPSLLSLWCHK